MDAPVPSPTKDQTAVNGDVAVTTTEAVITTATATSTAAAGAVTTDCVMSNMGSGTKGGVVPSQNGSIAHTHKPPSLTQSQKPPSLLQGQKPPSLSQGQKPPSVPGSFTQGQQPSQPFQPTLPTLPQLPEPLIPMSHPIDTKQEIVENYLNSLPPPATNGINLSNGSRMPIDISSSLAEGEPSLNQLMNGHGNGRYRGVSVDRYREYQPPGYYEENYYKRDPYDSSGDDRMTSYGKYDSLPGRYKTGGAGGGYHNNDPYHELDEPLSGGEERMLPRLERQWSHPNLRPRPSNQRKLPKTPKQPPGIVIPSTPSRQDEYFSDWIENERMRRTPMLERLPGQRSFESDNYSPVGRAGEHQSFSPPRSETRQGQARRTPVPDRPGRYHGAGAGTGTGRMLPKPPPGGSHLVLAGRDKQQARVSRERKLPKPSSLEIRNPGRDAPSRSTSINFPRIDSSPTRMSNFIDGTSIIPSLPPSRTVGYPRRNLPTID